MKKEKKISCVIDRLEENKAVLKFDDGQKLTVAIDFLPEGAAEGAILEINFGGPDKGDEDERIKQAKAMLNQILKKS